MILVQFNLIALLENVLYDQSNKLTGKKLKSNQQKNSEKGKLLNPCEFVQKIVPPKHFREYTKKKIEEYCITS